MKQFADLLNALVYQPARNAKVRLLMDYFARAPDPDRGFALAALAGTLDFPNVKAGHVRGLVEDRVDPILFRWSYDYVGDLAETAALIWPNGPEQSKSLEDATPPRLSEVVACLRSASRQQAPARIAGYLDRLDADGRYAFLKLVTGGMRIGVSARLARQALAQFGGQDVDAIEDVWHALEPPYLSLFAWLEGQGPKPAAGGGLGFRNPMLAHPVDREGLERYRATEFLAEWKWDGIRVQVAARAGDVRLYSRTGDDIGGAFPDIVDAARFDGTVDGELLIARESPCHASGGYSPGSFNQLQQRLNRKSPTKAHLRDLPAFVRLYDILFDAGEDLRQSSFTVRRRHLEEWYARAAPERFDLSQLIPFGSWDELVAIRAKQESPAIEGVMIKRAESSYSAGRPVGEWFKWKRDPLLADAVLMYARRGHGKRSSFYSDYTFGAWSDGTLVPIGKAYFGFTDAELAQLDKWVRANTTNRFGPVREVAPELVFEVAFDAVQRSTRHKSGIALRFPRIHRIRWDKPAQEADAVGVLEAMIRE